MSVEILSVFYALILCKYLIQFYFILSEQKLNKIQKKKKASFFKELKANEFFVLLLVTGTKYELPETNVSEKKTVNHGYKTGKLFLLV